MGDDFKISYHCPHCDKPLVWVTKEKDKNIYLCKNINCYITKIYYIDSLGNITEGSFTPFGITY